MINDADIKFQKMKSSRRIHQASGRSHASCLSNGNYEHQHLYDWT